MSRTTEKTLHDAALALFMVGMIGTVFHVGLAGLADAPTTHTGTQGVIR
jgi:hypothetical protein